MNFLRSILNQGKSGEIIRRIDDKAPDEKTNAKKPRLDKTANPTDILAVGFIVILDVFLVILYFWYDVGDHFDHLISFIIILIEC